ncbi:energy-coupling factor transporter transmembrane component T [Vagococcus carniphilus]|uniref:energy-coupling factor transporter transmembrane component T n=1 Tax=Vagococcus carniphilus TaxID=218144 RepID=UPI003B58EE8D
MNLRSNELAFERFHPFVLFLYYMTIIFFSMFTTNPILLGISLIGSLAYLLIIAKSVWKVILYYAVIFMIIMLTNPLFVHNGETILFFMNDKPVTLEAFLYGGMVGLMIVSIIFWFKSYNEVMTSDKFIYLFGNIAPKISITLSMILRYVPLFKEQIKKINMTQKTLGLYASDSYSDKLLSGLRVFRSLIGWSLENSVDVARSMKSRGYGLKGRTHFSLFKFYFEDALLLGMNLIFLMTIFLMVKSGIVSINYYPLVDPFYFTTQTVLLYIGTGLFVLLPTLIEMKEQLLWRLLISKI